MALTPDEVQTIDRLHRRWQDQEPQDSLLLAYYQGRQRVEQMGMAIPETMRKFLVIANWCRTVVDTIDSRQQVRGLILPGQEKADPLLREIWDANNLSAHLSMFNRDRMIYGRAFMSVGANEEDSELPIVRVESPREMVAEVDVRTERIKNAARFYGETPEGVKPTHVTLYKPEGTVWAQKDVSGKWVDVDRDDHRLGAVPIVMHLNRRLSGAWVGESQMSDVIPLADSAARALTNMQFTQEAHGAPRMWMSGVSQGDFIRDGKPIPKLEAYFNAVTTLTKENAKVGQLDAADLKNFETAMKVYGTQASIVTGFPARYFGITSVNPPAEGAIVADETTLVRGVESQNEQLGMTVGWVGALMYRFATEEWVTGNRVRADFHNPGTPTVAQREDALMKRRSQGVLSRRGYMVELGWSEARIDQELEWLADEATDPTIERVMREFGSGDPAVGA